MIPVALLIDNAPPVDEFEQAMSDVSGLVVTLGGFALALIVVGLSIWIAARFIERSVSRSTDVRG